MTNQNSLTDAQQIQQEEWVVEVTEVAIPQTAPVQAVRRPAKRRGVSTRADGLTDAQVRAIRWLPGDGSWTIESPTRLTSALGSLTLFRGELAQYEFGDFGPKGGKCVRRRLTPAGISVRDKLDAEAAEAAIVP